jgi:formylglycine-generating enzyme required for sulfatase activity
MKSISKTFLVLDFGITLIILSLFFSCQKSAQTVVNDGYGDYMLVPAGEFLMGDNFNDSFTDPQGLSSEKPVHAVYLNAYYIGKYEVTNGEYKKFMDDGGYTNPAYWTLEEWERASSGEKKDQRENPQANLIEHSYGRQPEFWNDSIANGGGITRNENFPVVGVNLHEANAYCKWLSENTGNTYRLPTEAEWEKAARGTDQRRYPWGNNIDSSYANYYLSGDPFESDLSILGGLTPVGFYNGDTQEGFLTQSNASPYGAYDMAGNVWEWVSDRWDPNYYLRSPIDNPTGPAQGDSIDYARAPKYGDYIASIRGGFWRDNKGNMNMNSLRSAYRSMIFSGPRRRGIGIGFRCVREVRK